MTKGTVTIDRRTHNDVLTTIANGQSGSVGTQQQGRTMNNDHSGKPVVKERYLRPGQACQCLGEASEINGTEHHRRWGTSTIAEVFAVSAAQ